MKYVLFLMLLTLGCVQYQNIKFTAQQADRLQFLLVDREFRAATELDKMFKNSRNITKEERAFIRKRYVKAITEFGRVADALQEKYPNGFKESRMWNRVSNLVNGLAVRDYPLDPEFAKAMKDW